jgi:hypothetical protein
MVWSSAPRNIASMMPITIARTSAWLSGAASLLPAFAAARPVSLAETGFLGFFGGRPAVIGQRKENVTGLSTS